MQGDIVFQAHSSRRFTHSLYSSCCYSPSNSTLSTNTSDIIWTWFLSGLERVQSHAGPSDNNTTQVHSLSKSVDTCRLCASISCWYLSLQRRWRGKGRGWWSSSKWSFPIWPLIRGSGTLIKMSPQRREQVVEIDTTARVATIKDNKSKNCPLINGKQSYISTLGSLLFILRSQDSRCCSKKQALMSFFHH